MLPATSFLTCGLKRLTLLFPIKFLSIFIELFLFNPIPPRLYPNDKVKLILPAPVSSRDYSANRSDASIFAIACVILPVSIVHSIRVCASLFWSLAKAVAATPVTRVNMGISLSLLPIKNLCK